MDEKVAVPQRALGSARAFVAAHGKPSRAVVENIGRSGVRVVLVGADGVLGDVIVASMDAAEALVTEVEGLEAASWDTETTAATKIGSAHRRRMAGSLLRR
ncbi:MAG: hypothetical protein GEU98_03605 [Pseudonocardiaceae bacterium]|nr:hypothetical protein [Pseudonocardiaceae bacterium]